MSGLIKKALIFVAVMALLAGGGWLGRKAYKRLTERRLLTQAQNYLGDRDFRNAALCLQRALQINPMSIGACRLMADTLEAAGAPALNWRIRLAQLEPGKVSNRLQWAQTALKAQDFKSAAQALGGVEERNRNTAVFHKLAGALAWSLGDTAETEKEYLEAIRLEPNNAANVLNLDTVRLTSTNGAVAQAARLSLENLSTNADLRGPALRHLAADAIAHTNLSRALNFSGQIIHDPASSFGDKIDYLELLRQTGNPEMESFLASLKAEATNSSAYAFGLARWIIAAESPTNALRWLESLPPAIRTNQPVPLVLTDCHIALRDWQGLLKIVQNEDWYEANSYRFALEALASRSIGQELPSQSAWTKAVHAAAHRLDSLARLAQVAAAFGWMPERKEVLNRIVSEFPREKWAADQLMAQLYQEGNTLGLASLLSKVSEADPRDVRLKNNLANVYLLRKAELGKAYRLAREAYQSSTNDPFFTSTYAYSLLLQKRQEEALKVFSNINPKFLEIPSVAAYYGVVQAQSGHKDAAKEPLERAAAASLLPEEKEMVRIAKAGL